MLSKKVNYWSLCLSSLIIILSVEACKSDSQQGKRLIESFDMEAVIEGDHLSFNEELIIGNFWLIDSLLVIKNGVPYGSFMEEDYIFYLYDKNSLTRVGHFGKPGRGPGELIDPEPTGQFISTDTGTIMVIYLPQNRQIVGVDINKIIGDETVGLTTVLARMPEDLGGTPLTPLLTSKGGVIGRVMGGQGRFFYWDGNEVSFTPLFPETSRIVPEPMKHMLYTSNSMLSPSNKLFVSALLFWKQIDLFSPELEHRYSLVFPDSPDDPEIIIPEGGPSRDVVIYFISLHVSEKYIYALHRGNRMYGDDDYKTTIYVFSHSGKPVASLETNLQIRYISVDSEDKYLYGTFNDDHGEVGLARFILPFR